MDSLFLLRLAVSFLTAYMLGNINGAVTVSKQLDNDDVRTKGSGNAGITNYLRTYGLRNSGLVAVIDLVKTVLACLVGGLLLLPYGYYLEGVMLGGLGATLGHDFPAILGFRGGKGILCGLGAALVADWRIALIVLGVFAVVVLLTRYVSLGSCLAALTLPICFVLFHRESPWALAGSICIFILALFMHRDNLQRLFHGTERKLSLRRKKERP